MTIDVVIVPCSEELVALLDHRPVTFVGRTTWWLEPAEGGVYVLRVRNDGGYYEGDAILSCGSGIEQP
jgi:hypothetical protein